MGEETVCFVLGPTDPLAVLTDPVADLAALTAPLAALTDPVADPLAALNAS